ncbi:MAG: exodeoxyribonuclease VII large subunit [Oscillospiraceae bacterium]|nr:exodeoxyribonuclease VII large subunit [Oscillospiraceae bacterium]MDD4413657.1 exodeoxyribonuclease VII large subunit [Oscillospiraceae bacterium]
MRVITISQLNRYVKSLLEGDKNLNSVYIGGEISNFTNHYKSGHLYMSLKDEGAIVRAVMFKAHASKLQFTPENGMKVIVRARVSLYEKDGSFQIYIEEMQPDGVGALQIAFEQLKKRLADEGLFDESRKRRLPSYPSKIGVITSPTGAAVRDIFNVLGRRYPLAEIVFAPVLVQGDGAPPQLINALKWFNINKAVDLIIIGRGGGSIEELWAFNDEGVVRAVAASHIPVISAVGHETDFTICDFAADLRAPTPSAAAELTVPDSQQLLSKLFQIQVITRRNLSAVLESSRQRLSAVISRRCLSIPLYYVEEQAMKSDYLTRSFIHAAQACLSEYDRRLGAISSKLDALSPLKVLSRGYSIPYVNDKVIKNVGDVNSGDSLSLRVSDGTIQCTVD